MTFLENIVEEIRNHVLECEKSSEIRFEYHIGFEDLGNHVRCCGCGKEWIIPFHAAIQSEKEGITMENFKMFIRNLSDEKIQKEIQKAKMKKQEKEFEDKKNKRKNKFTNAIQGLVLEEDKE